jgi:hypothetical protein
VKLKHIHYSSGRGYRLQRILLRTFFVILIAGILGGVAGNISANKYRDWFNYEVSESAIEVESVDLIAESEVGGIEGFVDRVKNAVGTAAEKSKAAITEALEENEIVREIRATQERFLNFGLFMAFWLPFSIVFLAGIFGLRFLLSFLMSILGETDAGVEHNLKNIIDRVNQLVDHANK